MWTKKDTQRVETLFEHMYWYGHSFEHLGEKWDGYLWNKANHFIKQSAWNEFREWLMCEVGETAIKDEMLLHLHFASPTVHEWITSWCKEQCVASKNHPVLPWNYASGAYLHSCVVEKRLLRSHAQAEKNSKSR